MSNARLDEPVEVRPPRAVDIEAYALSTMGGAIDEAPPARPGHKFIAPREILGRSWTEIALGMAGVGFAIVLFIAM